VPLTCKELLAATTGNDITLTVRPEGNRFRVEFEDIPANAPLRQMEDIDIGVHSLGLLTECKELYDPVRRTLYAVTLNVNAIMDLSSSKVHHYPELMRALRNVDTADFDWLRDTWKLSARIRNNTIYWAVLSTTTGEPWMRRTYEFEVHKEDAPPVTLEAYRADIEDVVPLSQLQNLEDVFEDLESTLRERYQEQQVSSDNEEEEEVLGDNTVEYEVDDEESFDEPDLEEVGKSVDVSKVYGNVTVRYKELEVRAGNVVVFLESKDGDCDDVIVVEKVHNYLEVSKLTGGIEPEKVTNEVTDKLAPYDLEVGELEVILNAVCEALENEGVNFYE
ncbi:MAG: hypothetical protein P1Q69_21440, partial [Candidatus Thorarchaeota archaeon]|nr:hypothetical protein [Candidatus Thorarchaeota archaeon]